MPDVLQLFWRTGRHNANCVYAVVNVTQDGMPVPSNGDIFLFTTQPRDEVAKHIVDYHNGCLIDDGVIENPGGTI